MGRKMRKTAFLKGSTNDGANQASYLLKRAPFLICKAKLSIRSTIDSQIDVTHLLFWGWLDHQGITSKEYLPNVLETTLLHQIFVYWVRDFKFWLLAYFFNFAELCKVWARLDKVDISHLIRVPLLNFG